MLTVIMERQKIQKYEHDIRSLSTNQLQFKYHSYRPALLEVKNDPNKAWYPRKYNRCEQLGKINNNQKAVSSSKLSMTKEGI